MHMWFSYNTAHKMNQFRLSLYQNIGRQCTAMLQPLPLAHLHGTLYHMNICAIVPPHTDKVADQWWMIMPRPTYQGWYSIYHPLAMVTHRGRVSPLTSKIIFSNLTSIIRWGIIIHAGFRASSAACGKWGIRNTDSPALWGTSWSHTVRRGSWNVCHNWAQIPWMLRLMSCGRETKYNL